MLKDPLGGAAMETTYPVTPNTADVMMIGGREHVLVHGFGEPLKIVDAKYLWLNTAMVWLLALYAVMVAFNLEQAGWWPLLGIVIAAAASLAIGAFMDHRAGVTTPIAVEEKDRTGQWSRLVIHTRRHDPLTVTADVRMADFLLATVADGPTPRFLRRPAVPPELRHPRAPMHAWITTLGWALTIPALAIIGIYLVAELM